MSGGAVHGDLVLLPVGETVTIGVRLEDPTESIWTGIGVSYYGYDDALLDFSNGEAVPILYASLCFPNPPNPPVCVNEMTNYVGTGAPGANRILAEGTVFPGVPLSGEPRVRAFFVFEHISVTHGYVDGPHDLGLDGVFGGGDAHARVTFTGVSDGTTEITIGTGDDLGGILLGDDGVVVPAGAQNARIRVAVPEPAFASALFVGGFALAAASRRLR